LDFHAEEGAYHALPLGKTTCRYVFFPGCRLGESNPQYVLSPARYLLDEYKAGICLGCCGVPALWAGESERFREHTDGIRAIWEAMGRPVFIFACPYCRKVFAEHVSEISGISLYELLSKAKIPPFSHLSETFSVFDPCAARDDETARACVRSIVAESGSVVKEQPEANRCCGFGGHMQIANPDLYETIVSTRVSAEESPYLVYCANCLDAFTLQGKVCVHVLDMVFGTCGDHIVPNLGERREHALFVKGELMNVYENREFQPRARAWDGMELLIGEAVQREMDDQFIMADDVKEAIWTAEKLGGVNFMTRITAPPSAVWQNRWSHIGFIIRRCRRACMRC
jgi:hypothetical protein